MPALRLYLISGLINRLSKYHNLRLEPLEKVYNFFMEAQEVSFVVCAICALRSLSLYKIITVLTLHTVFIAYFLFQLFHFCLTVYSHLVQ